MGTDKQSAIKITTEFYYDKWKLILGDIENWNPELHLEESHRDIDDMVQLLKFCRANDMQYGIPQYEDPQKTEFLEQLAFKTGQNVLGMFYKNYIGDP